jgi:hypothetical protein
MEMQPDARWLCAGSEASREQAAFPAVFSEHTTRPDKGFLLPALRSWLAHRQARR